MCPRACKGASIHDDLSINLGGNGTLVILQTFILVTVHYTLGGCTDSFDFSVKNGIIWTLSYKWTFSYVYMFCMF